jgi:uncharacterized repeat protein (TIGR01451 family)
VKKLKKHAIVLVMAFAVVMILCSSATAAEIPSNKNVNLTVSNDDGARFDEFGNDNYEFFTNQSTGQGLNTLKIASANTSTTGNVVFTSNQSGTFYMFDTGSVGWIDNGILMLAVNGTIPDNFKVTITSSGYVWTPVARNSYPLPNDLTYVTKTETFTKDDFLYGPQGWRPSTVLNYPIFEGQNMNDASNSFSIMFIDLYAGSIGTTTLARPEYSGLTLIDNGMIKITYAFENLDNLAAFNAYAYRVYSTTGTGVKWTNAINTAEQNDSAVSGYYVTRVQSGLYLQITPSEKDPVVGETVIYTLKVGNKGPDAAKDVVMTYKIPEGLEFVGANVDTGTYTYDPATRTITWTLGDVPVGDPYMWLSLRIVEAGQYLLNPTLSTSTFDPTLNSNLQSININAQEETTVRAAGTIGMQTTGAPLSGIAIAILLVLGGLVGTRRN